MAVKPKARKFHRSSETLREQFIEPETLSEAHARIKYGLRELVGGSYHRALDVLVAGCCEFPMKPFAEEIDLNFEPAPLPWPLSLPKTLPHATARLKSALASLEWTVWAGPDKRSVPVAIKALRNVK